MEAREARLPSDRARARRPVEAAVPRMPTARTVDVSPKQQSIARRAPTLIFSLRFAARHAPLACCDQFRSSATAELERLARSIDLRRAAEHDLDLSLGRLLDTIAPPPHEDHFRGL